MVVINHIAAHGRNPLILAAVALFSWVPILPSSHPSFFFFLISVLFLFMFNGDTADREH